jgi:hypothetical protein
MTDSNGFDFEVYDGARVRGGAIFLTLSRGRTFTLSARAMDALGSPSAIVLLYDREHRAIGVRVATDEHYQLRLTRKHSSSSTFSANSFSRFYDIEPTGERVPGELHGDTLVFRLPPVAEGGT